MEERRKTRRAFKAARLGWGLYQHVAAVFAAFGLAALIGHFWDLGWKGFLETFVAVWVETVQPVMTWIFHVLISVPLGVVGVDIEVPGWARDYLSVGLVLALSYVRTLRTEKDTLRPRHVSLFGKVPLPLELAYLVALWPIATLATGAALVLTLARGRNYDEFLLNVDRPARRAEEELARTRAESHEAFLRLQRDWTRRALLAFLRVASPLLYLALLLVVNFWVL